VGGEKKLGVGNSANLQAFVRGGKGEGAKKGNTKDSGRGKKAKKKKKRPNSKRRERRKKK